MHPIPKEREAECEHNYFKETPANDVEQCCVCLRLFSTSMANKILWNNRTQLIVKSTRVLQQVLPKLSPADAETMKLVSDTIGMNLKLLGERNE